MHAELLVIGAGTAGLRTAMTAAASKTKTVLIGDGDVAGTCLNNGCIPTKALLHAADTLRTVEEADEVGIKAQGKPDFKRVMERVNGIVHEGRTHAEQSVADRDNLTYIKGRAKLVAKKVVEVNNTRITADKIIIATGTRPSLPPIPGLDEVAYDTNENLLEIKKQPKHLLIIGGGYIACEFATFFATIGTKVTIVERAPSILGMLDDDVREVVKKSLESMGVRILTGVTTQNVSQSKTRFTLTLTGAEVERVSGDRLLVAAGRVPNTESLGLDAAGVKMDGRGFIPVDDQLRTSNKDIYAIGDVNGRDLFAHAAKKESWLALEHSLLHKRVKRPTVMPWAVFTHPVVAGFGPSERDLRKSGHECDVMVSPFRSAGKARIIREDDGFVKVLCRDGSILGAVIAGPEADNLIHVLLALQRLGDGAMAALNDLIMVHPSLAEVFSGLKPRR